MSEKTDREDMNRKLVKMTSGEFAGGFNNAFGRGYRSLLNREAVLLALILLSIVGVTIYRHFFG